MANADDGDRTQDSVAEQRAGEPTPGGYEPSHTEASKLPPVSSTVEDEPRR
jgi:hypothetical protein